METTIQNSNRYTMSANPNNGARPATLSALVSNFKTNFLTREHEIVPGLTINQYEIVKRVYFYQHNQFESGPLDENNNPKHFYDLITDRNDQATKNINLNTKDVYIKSETEGAYMKSWLLRREFVGYAKTSGFGKKLNDVADDLPDFGTVVWKKIKNKENRTDTAQVELINLMNDPGVKCLSDGMVIERHMLTQSEIRGKKAWDTDAIEGLISGGKTTQRVGFMDAAPYTPSVSFDQIDNTTPYYEVYELWGEIPKDIYDKSKIGGLPRIGKARNPEFTEEANKFYEGKNTVEEFTQAQTPHIYDQVSTTGHVTSVTSSNESVYVMAIVAGIGKGEYESVLFCKEVEKSQFPYKEVHYRRRKGRWLGVGNYEQCFPLIEKANELTNRFFASLRLALLHVYQTRDNTAVKNVLEDLLDGDLVVSKSEISAIPTEIRGFTQYKDELDRIEQKADRLCNSFEVVTGENLPAGTPWKLGNQQLKSATKLFEYIQENIGLFLEEVFNEWLLPDFAASLTEEHIIDIMDDMDDIEVYYNAQRKLFQYEVLKQYILEHDDYPDPAQLQLVGSLVKDQIKKGPKQIKIEKDYYANQKYSIKTVVTGENDAKKENLDTLSTAFQTLAANPAALQDQRLMKILNMILEQSGYSPLEINTVNETPTNPSLNPAMQGGAPQGNQTGGGREVDPAKVAAGAA